MNVNIKNKFLQKIMFKSKITAVKHSRRLILDKEEQKHIAQFWNSLEKILNEFYMLRDAKITFPTAMRGESNFPHWLGPNSKYFAFLCEGTVIVYLGFRAAISCLCSVSKTNKLQYLLSLILNIGDDRVSIAFDDSGYQTSPTREVQRSHGETAPQIIHSERETVYYNPQFNLEILYGENVCQYEAELTELAKGIIKVEHLTVADFISSVRYTPRMPHIHFITQCTQSKYISIERLEILLNQKDGGDGTIILKKLKIIFQIFGNYVKKHPKIFEASMLVAICIAIILFVLTMLKMLNPYVNALVLCALCFVSLIMYYLEVSENLAKILAVLTAFNLILSLWGHLTKQQNV